MLGAIESLLSAVVADGMAGTRHDPDSELLAQGIGNVIGPFFGGIPATGALARTATNIRYGARSPVAAIVHSGVILLAVLALAPLLGSLPMAALAALLVNVAWTMSEAKHFVHIVRVAPKSDVATLLTCFTLTVVFDMVIGVAVGLVMAAMLFMRRMADVTEARSMQDGHPLAAGIPVPRDVMLYDISGALFFGAAQKAMGTLQDVNDNVHAVVLHMGRVTAMDMTGLVALESAIAALNARHCVAILSTVREQPLSVLQKARFVERYDVAVCRDLPEALALADLARTPRAAAS